MSSLTGSQVPRVVSRQLTRLEECDFTLRDQRRHELFSFLLQNGVENFEILGQMKFLIKKNQIHMYTRKKGIEREPREKKNERERVIRSWDVSCNIWFFRFVH